MDRFEKAVIVTRPTRLQGLLSQYQTRQQASFYLKRAGVDFKQFSGEHDTYQYAVEQIRKELSRRLKVQVIDRSFLPNFLFTDKDIIITIGIDGLVVNTAKYLSGQPLIAVNPDPERIDGTLLPFTTMTTSQAVDRVLSGKEKYRQVTMAKAILNNGQHLLAFNDLFIGTRSHISARYRISWQNHQENHSSSGIIISTGIGSTGWMSSVVNMVNGWVSQFQSQSPPLPYPKLSWEDERLLFVVREPFVSKMTSASLVSGYITASQPLQIESQMDDAGVIFSDGIETDFLSFAAGSIATITLSEQHTRLVIG
ncbi:hypothetical protein SAMN05444392_10836 [Seinonella peptonophila]|uniref:NAD kinase n=1 Tax=Seinonella peptonophila TaxID=112248 RepID=A0A1M4Z4H2_9BACL|nr:hypothetical protein [Seinonella peptonophila]SHF12983.1 hypothetical protein SAMN05444392_10836 [Seinonella peptonophila]